MRHEVTAEHRRLGVARKQQAEMRRMHSIGEYTIADLTVCSQSPGTQWTRRWGEIQRSADRPRWTWPAPAVNTSMADSARQ